MLEHLINPQVKDIQISGIRKISNLVSTDSGALTLTIGQPDFPTPRHIIEAGKGLWIRTKPSTHKTLDS